MSDEDEEEEAVSFSSFLLSPLGEGGGLFSRSPNFAHRAPRCATRGYLRALAGAHAFPSPIGERRAERPRPRRAMRDYLRAPGGDLGNGGRRGEGRGRGWRTRNEDGQEKGLRSEEGRR